MELWIFNFGTLKSKSHEEVDLSKKPMDLKASLPEFMDLIPFWEDRFGGKQEVWTLFFLPIHSGSEKLGFGQLERIRRIVVPHLD